MPYVNNDGVRIHYHTEGNGMPLVLQHGFTGSLKDWCEAGINALSLKKDYRIILIDARGHGASDKPHDPEAYELELRALDIIAVLDDLEIDGAHYWGYSMGGWIGFGLAKHHPRRVTSMILGGAHPYYQSWQEFRDALSNGIKAFADGFMDYARSVAPGYAERLYSNDAKALEAAQQDRLDMRNLLPSMAMPCLIYAGEADPIYSQVIECAEHLPNATFLSLPGLDHLKAFVDTDLVLPKVQAFLAEHSKE